MSTVFVVIGIVAVVSGAAVFCVWRFLRADRHGLPLAGTVLLSIGLLGLVTGWLLADHTTSRGDALKTGGLAAGSVVALYALWLNDRRRRVEESRQDLERERTDHDRARVADERFGRAVELLGNDADQVRVGALHVLAGLAGSSPGYTQTVLDVLCSYLRRPFDHHTYPGTNVGFDGRDAADRERQVRVTAQRLIAELLPPAASGERGYDLDLTGATLEYFDISGRAVGTLTARNVRLHTSNSMWGCRVHGNAWFTAARGTGPFYVHDTVFGGKAWFSGFHAEGPVYFARSTFLGRTKFDGAVFEEKVTFDDTTATEALDLSGATLPA